MLPTDKADASIWMNTLGNIEYDPIRRAQEKGQHLYFTTDDEIKEGDWCLMFWDGGEVASEPQQYLPENGHVLNRNLRKIIATTDSEFVNQQYTKEELGYEPIKYGLPQPSKAFIEKYCEEGGIDEVDVEYNDKGVVLRGRGGERTITIHSIKDSWSREEVKMQLQYCVSLFASERGLTPTSVEMKEVNDWVSNWIKENL